MRKQMPGIPDDSGNKGTGGALGRSLIPPPASEETMEKLDSILKGEARSKRRNADGKPQCCGILPCKGRTMWCYECDLCMDCITGAGCGHSSSRHKFTQAEVGDDDE